MGHFDSVLSSRGMIPMGLCGSILSCACTVDFAAQCSGVGTVSNVGGEEEGEVIAAPVTILIWRDAS